MKKDGRLVCNGIKEIYKEIYAEERARAREYWNGKIYALVEKGKLLPVDAAESFEISVDQLREKMTNAGYEFPAEEQVPPFQVFRNNLHHELKNSGALCFVKKYLENNRIQQLWDSGNYLYSLYLLSMVDYLSLENGLPLAEEYREIRSKKLQEPYYCGDSKKYIEGGNIEKKPIDTFLTHNIYEGDIYDAV